MDRDSKQFTAYLREGSTDELQSIPKSDLHNHAGRGGNLRYISAWAKACIAPPRASFASLGEMQKWLEQNVKVHCPGLLGYLKRVEASFAQAQKDSIRLLALSFGPDEIGLLGSSTTSSVSFVLGLPLGLLNRRACSLPLPALVSQASSSSLHPPQAARRFGTQGEAFASHLALSFQGSINCRGVHRAPLP
jgi:hypothetical protein